MPEVSECGEAADLEGGCVVSDDDEPGWLREAAAILSATSVADTAHATHVGTQTVEVGTQTDFVTPRHSGGRQRREARLMRQRQED